jgi:Tol biopolymer transport system component
MEKRFCYAKTCCRKASCGLHVIGAGILTILIVSLFVTREGSCESQPPVSIELRSAPSARSEIRLAEIPFKIVYESLRKTNGKENWELFLVSTDGSNPVNLTNTANVDDMYPHVSPDGRKICFVADEMVNAERVRNVYYMNIDGTGRTKVADNARQPCWSPDGKTIAYLKAEFERYTTTDYATKGVFFYDIETGKHRQHPNKQLYHLYNLCWSPDGKWFAATVHGGMGFKHANLILQADGTDVFDLTKYGVTGCRPDFSPDAKRITWGKSDWDLCVADIDLTVPAPTVSNVRRVVNCDKDCEVYHSDFSPDGKYIAFSYGPKAEEIVGGKAPGWDICVGDLTGKYVKITTDGNHNKEPDWVAAPRPSR